jgi:endogenous inhibitor of DNA gyrase (YacG/DUF329 family)
MARLPTTKPCPICGKPPVEKFRPFCSARCADIDLNRWFTGAYAIPAEPIGDEEGGLGVPDGSGDEDEF